MTNLELIDRLCGVINLLNDIIKDQAFYINEMIAVDGSIEDLMAAKRKNVDDTLDFLEIVKKHKQ